MAVALHGVEAVDRPSIDTLWAQYRGVETGTSILPNGTLNIGHKARAVPPRLFSTWECPRLPDELLSR
jgi:hypothetical protein